MNENTMNFLRVASMVAQVGAEKRDYNHDNTHLLDQAKELTKKIDFTRVDLAIAQYLGFKGFSDETVSAYKFLVPLWLFDVLPDDMSMTSIFGKVITKSKASNDARFGCVAYMIEVGSDKLLRSE